jgi:hypothetical protein
MSSGSLAGERLSLRALNRATLARQHLLAPAALSPEALVTHLVALQAQAPAPPATALWTRLPAFTLAAYDALHTSGALARMTLLRGTLHVVARADAVPLHRALAPLLRPLLFRNELGKPLVGLDPDALARAGRAALADGPLSADALGDALAATFPGRPPRALAYGLRFVVPLLQLPPLAYALADDPGPPLSPEVIVRRYLAAFGPASVADLQKWSGLTRLSAVVQALRPSLDVLHDPDGVVLFDLPGAPRPSPDEPAPVRYLSEFENLLLAYADTRRVIRPEDRARVFTANGIVRGTVLVDGFVAGIWRQPSGRSLRVELFRPAPEATRAALHDEGRALLTFLAPGVSSAIEIVET